MNKDLIEEVIAEIKRDIDMNNLMTLRELLEKLAEEPKTKSMLIGFLSEFPELREKYKDQPDEEQDWIKMNNNIKKPTDITKLKNVWEEKSTKKKKQNDWC